MTAINDTGFGMDNTVKTHNTVSGNVCFVVSGDILFSLSVINYQLKLVGK